jgi:FixJ family two-component response regulator
MNAHKGQRAKAVIYIVDGDGGMRKALSMLMSVAGYEVLPFERPSAFLQKLDITRTGCLILDASAPEMSGIEVQQRLRHRGSLLPVIMTTSHSDIPTAVQAMKDGAFDFLQKPLHDQDLLKRIGRALELDASNRESAQRRADLKRRIDSLTPREREVLNLVVDGRANKVTAIDLGLSERTVEIHRSNVMEKMRARSMAHLVKMHLTLQGEPFRPG